MVASRASEERDQSRGWPADAHAHHICSHYRSLLQLRRDLHDQVGSSLAGMTTTIDVARRSLPEGDTRTDRLLADLRVDVTALLDHVRGLLTGDEPRPAGAVSVALRSMISGMSRVVGDRIEISLDVDPSLADVPDDVAWDAFWIVREAMTNVTRHSGARHCAVTLAVRDDLLHVSVRDDGVGIDRVRPAGGSGLATMTSRATDHGGWCSIEPAVPHGVTVTAVLPLREAR